MEKKGFSRRHQSNEAHENVKADRELDVAEKLAGALARQEVAKQRTPVEQLRRLNERLGGNAVGALRERTRLAARIIEAK